jgi:predicted permease
MLVESLALALLGGILGVGLAYVGLHFLVATAPATLPRLGEISIDPLVLIFALAMSLLSALLFGLLPILKHAGAKGAQALHGAARGDSRTLSHGRGQRRSQNTLVFVQVALAVVLLVSAGLMIRSFVALRSVEPGFVDPDRIQTVRISIPEGRAAEPARVARVQQDIMTEIAKIFGVTSASFTTALPMELDYENNTVVTAADKIYSEGIPQLRRSKSVGPGFFQTMGIPLLVGRDFTWTDIEGRRRVAIVSNNLAREWWGEPSAAIGKQIRIGRVGPLNEIIGVAGDIYDSGADQPPPTVVYWRAGAQDAFGPIPTFVPRDMAFAIRSDQAGTEDLIRQVARAVWAVDSNLPLARVQTLGEIYAQSMSRTSFTLVMLAIAGVMALALGLVGIYGVISYAVTEQRRAIGIRLALGAARGSILGRFLVQGIRVTGIACVAGIVLSLAVRGAMSRLLFGVSPYDPITLVGVAGVVLSVATLAALIPATRAAFMQPMRTLREE